MSDFNFEQFQKTQLWFGVALVIAVLIIAGGMVATVFQIMDQPVQQGVTNFDAITTSGNVTVGGTLANTGAVTFSSTGAFTDKLTASGEVVFGATTLTVTGGSTLTPVSSYYHLDSGGAVTVTLGTTGISTGQLLIMYGDDNNTITVNDTNIRTTDGSTLDIGQYDLAVFVFNGTDWVEWSLAADS